MRLNLEWEAIYSGGDEDVHRAMIPGGWLVLHSAMGGAGGITFVPDPEHRWAVNKYDVVSAEDLEAIVEAIEQEVLEGEGEAGEDRPVEGYV